MKTSKLVNHLPVLLFILAVLYFIGGSSFSFTEFPLDDAWIHRVYARSIAQGHGFAYNAGTQEAGSTSPLWSILTAPPHWLENAGTDVVVLLVKIIGIILGLLVVWSVQNIAIKFTNSKSIGILTASFIALEPRLLYSTLSGMETNLLLALLLCGITALLHRKRFLALILFSLTPVTRPEALLFFPFIVLIFLMQERQKSLVKTFVELLILGIPMMVWIVFCLFTNSHLLPNTFYVKATSFQFGLNTLKMAWPALTEHGYAVLIAFPVGILAFLIYSYTQKNSLTNILFLMLFTGPVIYLFGVLMTHPFRLEGYYWTRWVDPASILMTVSFCLGYAVLIIKGIKYGIELLGKRTQNTKNQRSPIFNTGILYALGMILLVVSVPSFTRTFLNRKSYLASDSRVIYLMNVQCGKWINENTDPEAVIGIIDAGAIKYFGKRHTIDLTGLNYADLAFQRIRRTQAINTCHWLAVFTVLFRGTHQLDPFIPRMEFHVPFEEFTICRAPDQTTIVLYQRMPR